MIATKILYNLSYSSRNIMFFTQSLILGVLYAKHFRKNESFQKQSLEKRPLTFIISICSKSNIHNPISKIILHSWCYT